MKGYIHSIESMGTVDGPGIRFVVFLQGCPLRCQYCHNPDTWEMGKGNLVDTDEIINEYNRCKNFLKNGGITVTGGEPLLQIEFVLELFQKARNQGIHTCIDTSGIIFCKLNERVVARVNELMEYTDLVLLDIKHIDEKEHKKLTGSSNQNVLEFAKFLDDKKIPVWIRHVVVPNITDREEYLLRLGYFLGGLNNIKALDVLPYHTMGVEKYSFMGIEYPLLGIPPLQKEKAVNARNIILSAMKERRKIK